MAPRSKADAEEATIVSLEIVADNLMKQVSELQRFIQVLKEQKTISKGGGDSGERG